MEKNKKLKVAVILRVFSRIDDLKLNIQIINDLWKRHKYSIYVIFNGVSAGYELYDGIETHVSKVISLTNNSGHLTGNSQLLLKGMESLDDEFDYIILLEADTWLMGDKIIDKYIKKLEETCIVWASSEWIESRHSVGMDFALTKAQFIKSNYQILFNFSEKPEMWIAENLLKDKSKFIFIKEMMPVHRPSIIKRIYNADGGRLRVFPAAKMVTHHYENLPNKLENKKVYADIAYGTNYFTDKSKSYIVISNILYTLLNFLLKKLPRSRWVKRKKTTFKSLS